MTGLLRMFFARVAYMSVLRVSSKWAAVGEQHAIISARDEPPRESISSLVSLESRYGMCTLPLWFSASAEMTCQGTMAGSIKP